MSDSRTGLSLEEQAYEQDELWKEGALGKDDEARVAALAGRIPPGVQTVLDVGCGNGLFLHHLQASSRRWTRLVGADRSRTALQYVSVEHVEASIDGLPFQDREFDLVSCFEVIEHLPIPTYQSGLAELARVSAKYLFFCVPFAEDLQKSLSTCPSCHTRFNVNHHLREYQEMDICRLPLPMEFRCVATFGVGQRSQLAPLVISTLHFAKQWLRRQDELPSYAVCPMCGYHPGNGREKTGVGIRRESSLKKVAMRLLPKVSTYRWIAGIYERH